MVTSTHSNFNFLVVCALLLVGLVGVENVQKNQFFHPIPTIRPIYFVSSNVRSPLQIDGYNLDFIQNGPEFYGRKSVSSTSSEEVQNNEGPPYPVFSSEADSKESSSEDKQSFRKALTRNSKVDGQSVGSSEEIEESKEVKPRKRQPHLGDRGLMEDMSQESRFRLLWPDASTTITLTKKKKSPYHGIHYQPHGFAEPSWGYHDYVEQMHNVAKGLDFDGLDSIGGHDRGDGWDGDHYGLTDDEILHSKGYKKYRKKLKKSAKHLKKKIKLLRWVQKFLEEKKFFGPGIIEADVIAPN